MIAILDLTAGACFAFLTILSLLHFLTGQGLDPINGILFGVFGFIGYFRLAINGVIVDMPEKETEA